ncbi:MAG: glycosyltransferase, partial [Sphingopyxis sp.]
MPVDIAVYLYEPGQGGLDRVAILLANGFAARGLSTQLWMTRTHGDNAHNIATTVTVRAIPALPARRGLALAAQTPILRRVVKQVRPRILLSAGNQSNLPVALACRGTGTAAIAKITNPMVRPGPAGMVKRILGGVRCARFRRTSQMSAATIVLGAAEQADLAAAWPMLADRIHTLPLPIVCEEMEGIGRARSAADWGNPPRLLSLGRLVPQKDHAMLLDAMALLADQPWHLTIAG